MGLTYLNSLPQGSFLSIKPFVAGVKFGRLSILLQRTESNFNEKEKKMNLSTHIPWSQGVRWSYNSLCDIKLIHFLYSDTSSDGTEVIGHTWSMNIL